MRPCFTSARVEQAEKSGKLQEEEAEIIYSAGQIYAGELQSFAPPKNL